MNTGANGALPGVATTINSSRPGQFTVNSTPPSAGAARAVGPPTINVVAATVAPQTMASRRLSDMSSPPGLGLRCHVGEKTETTTSQPGCIGAGHESGHKQEVIARRGLYFANAWSTVCAHSPSVPRRQSVCCWSMSAVPDLETTAAMVLDEFVTQLDESGI